MIDLDDFVHELSETASPDVVMEGNSLGLDCINNEMRIEGVLILLVGFYVSPSIVLGLIGIPIVFVIVFALKYLVFYIKESILEDQKPPIAGPILNYLVHFNRHFDYQTSIAKKYSTFRLITPSHSEIYTADPLNVDYILKTKFSNYEKVVPINYNYGIMRDLFGDGIFAVDGHKWRHQRKLASYEFSTRVLRDFSSAVFRANAAKLVSKITVAATALKSIDLQDMLMKSTLDSIFKVGFGFELNALSGLDESGSRFTKAFDDSNSIVFWRYVDLILELKRFLNFGSEASLKQNIKVINDFIFELIRCKREQMKTGKLEGGKEDILSRFLLESEKDPENMTDQYLRDITLNFIIAGKDTSANTLAWFFYMLCKHPLVQEKVVKEVREAVGIKESMSADEFSKLMTEEALDKMQYLHASLTETLRLYPAVPLDGKSAAEDEILPNGFKVKKGDGITYMAYRII
eukprot:XP_024437877.1 cytochrome P450 704C1 [Populus trichocarpa]